MAQAYKSEWFNGMKEWPDTGKTGPHSFRDVTGVEWHIVGYSKHCGAAYADCRTEDGKALTVRPIAYLAPAGLSLPEGSEPHRAATSGEKKQSADLYERMEEGAKHLVPEAERTEPPKAKRTRKPKAQPEGAQVIALPTDDPVRAYTTALSVAAAETFHAVAAGHEPGCECGNCAHEHYGCLLCGDKTGACTPTTCASPEEPSQVAPGDTAAPGRARVVNVHRDGYDVLIGRPSPWDNPYSHLPDSAALYVVETRERAIDLYRDWMRQRVRDGEPGLVEALASLHGLRLGCYCAPEACHGQVLVDAAEWAAGVLAVPPVGA